MKIKVLIFAAGIGSRLGLGVPKILARVAGRSILSRHVESLGQMGIDPVDVTIVTGYKTGEVEKACVTYGLNTLYNLHWRNTGTYSSFSVAPPSDDHLLIIHGDLVWDAGLGISTINGNGDIVVPVDPGTGSDREAMKAEICRGRILHLSKSLPVFRSAGESMGMFFVRSHRVLHDLSAHLLSNSQATFDDAVNIAAAVLHVEAICIDKCKWEEIDTQEDLAAAERIFS